MKNLLLLTSTRCFSRQTISMESLTIMKQISWIFCRIWVFTMYHTMGHIKMQREDVRIVFTSFTSRSKIGCCMDRKVHNFIQWLTSTHSNSIINGLHREHLQKRYILHECNNHTANEFSHFIFTRQTVCRHTWRVWAQLTKLQVWRNTANRPQHFCFSKMMNGRSATRAQRKLFATFKIT